MRPRALLPLVLMALSAAALASCAAPSALAPTFGAALGRDLAAQVASPTPAYTSAPPADGARVSLAQSRYQEGKVITPITASTSQAASQASAGP